MQENPGLSPFWCSVTMGTFSIAWGVVADNTLFDFFISFLSLSSAFSISCCLPQEVVPSFAARTCFTRQRLAAFMI